MNKIIVFILFIIIHLNVNAQEHLKFKGIEINGNVNAFAKLLEKDGFKLVENRGSILCYNGDFATYENCLIVLGGSKLTSTIWKVLAIFPKDDTWSGTKRIYVDLKTQLNSKYGVGESAEYFNDLYKEGDGLELFAFSLEKAVYATIWKLSNGIISLEISSTGEVLIHYEDLINSKIESNERDSKMSNDL